MGKQKIQDMKTIFAVIFAICVLNSSVSAGSTEACNSVLNALSQQLGTFYNAGKTMKDNNAMTAEYQEKFDGAAYQVAEAVYAGCGGLSTTEVDSIAQSIFTAPADCKKYAGMFAESMVKGIEDKESKEGCWDGLYQYAEICEA